MDHPRDLVDRLAAHPRVVGVVRYGGRAVDAAGPGGDLDLFLILDDRPPELESVHFYLGTLPVDLNLRTWRDLEQPTLLTPIDGAIFDGEVLYDRDGDLGRRLHALRRRWASEAATPTSHEIASIRFGQRHSLDKVAGRLASDPLLCRMLLESNVYWAIRHYFTLRRLPFPGERGALHYLAEHEPATHRDIEAFYTTAGTQERLRLAEAVSERVLAPAGGLWRRDEVLAFGTGVPTDDLQAAGRRFLAEIIEW